MLPAGRHVAEVYERDIFAAAAAGGALLIDCSTIDVATARSVAAAAAGRGLTMVDAPVSGGIAAANGGTLTFMVGGPDDGFARAEPILKAMGKAVIHAGASGAGQAAKICNNMLLGDHDDRHLRGVQPRDPARARSADLLRHQLEGVGAELVDDELLPGAGRRCPPRPPIATIRAGSQAALMLKDLKLALDAAKGADASIPMGAQAETLYQMFAGLGGGPLDFSAIIKLIDGSWRTPAAA